MAMYRCGGGNDKELEVVEIVLKATTNTIKCEIGDIIFAWSVFPGIDRSDPVGAVKLGGGLGPAAGGADSRGYAYKAIEQTVIISNGANFGYMILRNA